MSIEVLNNRLNALSINVRFIIASIGALSKKNTIYKEVIGNGLFFT